MSSLAEAQAIRELVRQLRGERPASFTMPWRTAVGLPELYEALARTLPGDRYLLDGCRFEDGSERALVCRVRGPSFRVVGSVGDLDSMVWLHILSLLKHAAPAALFNPLFWARLVPHHQHAKVVTAQRRGVPAELRLKPRSRLKFPCEAPANDVGAAS